MSRHSHRLVDEWLELERDHVVEYINGDWIRFSGYANSEVIG